MGELCIFAECMGKTDAFIIKLSKALEGTLPGPESQFKMAPRLRLENNNGLFRNAAVLVLLYRKEEKWQFVLMKRPEYPGHHSNQVSLPGGIFEEGDPDLGATALRETREEIGIDDSPILILGKLSKLHIPVSGIEVSPYVGYYPENPVFKPDPAEVSYLIEVPLSDLLSPETAKDDIRTILCKPVRVPYFNIAGEQVWGATAMILSEFIDVVRSLEGAGLQ